MPFSICMRDCYDTCSVVSGLKDGRLRNNPEHPITAGFLCPQGSTSPEVVPRGGQAEKNHSSEQARGGAASSRKRTGMRRLGWLLKN